MNDCFNSVKTGPAPGIQVVEVSSVRREAILQLLDDPFVVISKAQEALNTFWE